MFDFPSSPTVGQQYAPANGPVYQWNGVSWGTSSIWPGGGMVERFYTANATWVKPSNLKYLEVEMQAPGSGGGGAGATTAGNYAVGAGGGGGGWNTKLFAAADLAASVAITIGAAGTGTTGTGGSGGSSTFAGLTVSGGSGGTAGVQNALGGHSAGIGGASAGFDVDGRSGGGGVQSFWNVSISMLQRGYGANSPYGMGGAGGSGTADGQAAQGYGAGGGGAGNSQSAAAARPGGAGAPGFIRVREYITDWTTAASPPAIATRTFVTSSNAAWPLPAGCRFFSVEGIGGGGGGGAVVGAASSFGAGGGGGSGAYGTTNFLDAATYGPTLNLTVGAAGAAGSTASGSPGGTTTLVAGAGTWTWNGGTGGGGGTATAAGVWVEGGEGGLWSGVIGGSWGGFPPIYSPTYGVCIPGKGAGTPRGRGGDSQRGTGTFGSPGTAGYGYGSGGSGAVSMNQASTRAGGAGGPGLFVIDCYF